ncbi:MAG: DUF2721 domain-containing protein [Bacteroidota bacterium]
MDISINTPALLFPAISLIMLAYGNRFLAISNRIRNLHDRYNANEKNVVIHGQIKSLRYRLRLIKNMQFLGSLSILLAIVTMFLIYSEKMELAHFFFAVSLILFTASLIVSLVEIQLSTKALELELSDIEGLEETGLVDYLKKKFD